MRNRKAAFHFTHNRIILMGMKGRVSSSSVSPSSLSPPLCGAGKYGEVVGGLEVGVAHATKDFELKRKWIFVEENF